MSDLVNRVLHLAAKWKGHRAKSGKVVTITGLAMTGCTLRGQTKTARTALMWRQKIAEHAASGQSVRRVLP
jgi:hypothetical protein